MWKFLLLLVICDTKLNVFGFWIVLQPPQMKRTAHIIIQWKGKIGKQGLLAKRWKKYSTCGSMTRVSWSNHEMCLFTVITDVVFIAHWKNLKNYPIHFKCLFSFVFISSCCCSSHFIVHLLIPNKATRSDFINYESCLKYNCIHNFTLY